MLNFFYDNMSFNFNLFNIVVGIAIASLLIHKVKPEHYAPYSWWQAIKYATIISLGSLLMLTGLVFFIFTTLTFLRDWFFTIAIAVLVLVFLMPVSVLIMKLRYSFSSALTIMIITALTVGISDSLYHKIPEAYQLLGK